MDYTHLTMTLEQAAKFDKHIVSTRIRAGRSVDTLALPPSTDRKQRRTVEFLLTNALAGMGGCNSNLNFIIKIIINLNFVTNSITK
jgi:hypothetical protein